MLFFFLLRNSLLSQAENYLLSEEPQIYCFSAVSYCGREEGNFLRGNKMVPWKSWVDVCHGSLWSSSHSLSFCGPCSLDSKPSSLRKLYKRELFHLKMENCFCIYFSPWWLFPWKMQKTAEFAWLASRFPSTS